MKRTQILLVLALLLATAWRADAVSLPAIFGDHMLVQQNSDLKLHGWGKPLEKIAVTSGWMTDTVQSKVDSQGNWSLSIPTPDAGGPYSMTIQGYNTIELTDVMVGELWLLSGQSNMEWTFRQGVIDGEEAVKTATNDQIRLFVVTNRTASCPNYDVDGHWMVCSPETVYNFSAVGYFFGRKLQNELGYPVGLLLSSWGGTPVEAWTPQDEIAANDQLAAGAAKLKPVPWGPVGAGSIYNAMIAPLMPLPIAGALWYQGEANTENPDTYEAMLKTMIRSWRMGFEKAFPFYLVQIAPLRGYPGESGVEIRDAQRRVLSEPGTGMVVVSDVGDTVDIHPRRKWPVGERLADLAMNQAYGLSDYPASGPLFAGFQPQKNKIIVRFDYAEGLHADGPLNGFEVAGADGKWYPAKAEIKGETVVLKSSKVSLPEQVRFEWKNSCVPTLFNDAGLPASSFTSVDWMRE